MLVRNVIYIVSYPFVLNRFLQILFRNYCKLTIFLFERNRKGLIKFLLLFYGCKQTSRQTEKLGASYGKRKSMVNAFLLLIAVVYYVRIDKLDLFIEILQVSDWYKSSNTILKYQNLMFFTMNPYYNERNGLGLINWRIVC